MVDIHAAAEMILAGRCRIPAHESMLVAVSGIDGSGKGYVTERIVACVQQKAVNAMAVNVDGWLNLSPRRFHEKRSAKHFDRQAIRFDDMFAQLILPQYSAVRHRSCRSRGGSRLHPYHTGKLPHLYPAQTPEVVPTEPCASANIPPRNSPRIR